MVWHVTCPKGTHSFLTTTQLVQSITTIRLYFLVFISINAMIVYLAGIFTELSVTNTGSEQDNFFTSHLHVTLMWDDKFWRKLTLCFLSTQSETTPTRNLFKMQHIVPTLVVLVSLMSFYCHGMFWRNSCYHHCPVNGLRSACKINGCLTELQETHPRFQSTQQFTITALREIPTLNTR